MLITQLLIRKYEDVVFITEDKRDKKNQRRNT